MKRKNILVAIDHSRQSIDAATYISAMIHPSEYSVTLFHVDSDLFDIFFDYDEMPPTELTSSSHFSDWMNIKRHSIDDNMDHVKRIFVTRQFPEDCIRIVKHPLDKGVARDILNESRHDYSLLVTGKSGSNRYSEDITGTVTAKLLSRTFHIPLVIVAGAPDTSKILLGYDGSKGADKAVGLTAGLIRKDKDLIKICHVIRSFDLNTTYAGGQSTTFYNSYLPELEEALVKIRKNKMQPLLNNAADCFIKQGFLPSRVHSCILNRTISRSKTLVSTARTEHFGTIMLGRRGHSAVEEFFIGRVGKKVVEMADSVAVWII